MFMLKSLEGIGPESWFCPKWLHVKDTKSDQMISYFLKKNKNINIS